MKIFTNVLIILCVLLVLVNIYMLDFSNLLKENSKTALIGIIASTCAVLILLIFKLSKKIEQNIKK
jgi:Mg2+ and Co2+ transporter CorA